MLVLLGPFGLESFFEINIPSKWMLLPLKEKSKIEHRLETVNQFKSEDLIVYGGLGKAARNCGYSLRHHGNRAI